MGAYFIGCVLIVLAFFIFAFVSCGDLSVLLVLVFNGFCGCFDLCA